MPASPCRIIRTSSEKLAAHRRDDEGRLFCVLTLDVVVLKLAHVPRE